MWGAGGHQERVGDLAIGIDPLSPAPKESLDEGHHPAVDATLLESPDELQMRHFVKHAREIEINSVYGEALVELLHCAFVVLEYITGSTVGFPEPMLAITEESITFRMAH